MEQTHALCDKLIGGHYHTYVALIGANGDVCQDKHATVTSHVRMYVRTYVGWLCVMCTALCVMCSAFRVSGTSVGCVCLLVHTVLSAVL